MTLLVVVLVLVAAVVVAGAVVVRSQKRQFTAANEVVPGTPTHAPAAWAGAHTPEARLHRRLREAVAGLRANPAMEDAAMMDARVALEQHALAVDDRLVAVAALPERVRAQPLVEVASAVEAVEAAVASYVSGPAQRDGLDRAMAEVAEKVASLQQEGGTV